MTDIAASAAARARSVFEGLGDAECSVSVRVMVKSPYRPTPAVMDALAGASIRMIQCVPCDDGHKYELEVSL